MAGSTTLALSCFSSGNYSVSFVFGRAQYGGDLSGLAWGMWKIRCSDILIFPSSPVHIVSCFRSILQISLWFVLLTASEMSSAVIGLSAWFIWASQLSARWRLMTSVSGMFISRFLYSASSGGFQSSFLPGGICCPPVFLSSSAQVTCYSISAIKFSSAVATIWSSKSVLGIFPELATKIWCGSFDLTCAMLSLTRHEC